MFLPMVKISYWNRPLPSICCILRTPNKIINILKYRWTNVHDKRSNVENTRIQSIFRVPNEVRLTRTFNPSGTRSRKKLYRFLLRRTPRKWPMTTYVTRLYLIVVIISCHYGFDDGRHPVSIHHWIRIRFKTSRLYLLLLLNYCVVANRTQIMYNIQYRRGKYYNVGCILL